MGLGAITLCKNILKCLKIITANFETEKLDYLNNFIKMNRAKIIIKHFIFKTFQL